MLRLCLARELQHVRTVRYTHVACKLFKYALHSNLFPNIKLIV